jgi:hypothetical protein
MKEILAQQLKMLMLDLILQLGYLLISQEKTRLQRNKPPLLRL